MNDGHRIKKSILLFILAIVPMCALSQSFQTYLEGVSQQAIERGVDPLTIKQAFAGLEPDERVIGYDRKQPEFVQTFEEYLQSRVSEFRIVEARRLFDVHQDLLQRVSLKYGVDPEYIVAFWALETSFGRYQGKMSIIRSLATLGYDPRRSAFFTQELIDALVILDQGHVPLERFVGAWAGAMGQNQFMPSSFLNFAVDFDGDGKKDIWANEADVFASIANYLAKNGWKKGAGWGKAVVLPNSLDFAQLKPVEYDTSCRGLIHHTRKMPLSEWAEMGVTATTITTTLPDNEYAVLVPETDTQQSYLVGGNFRVILRYNCANKYAVSVGLLADLISHPESS